MNRGNKINTPYSDRLIRHKIQKKARRNVVTLMPKQAGKAWKTQKNMSTQKCNKQQKKKKKKNNNNNLHPLIHNW